MAPARRLRTYLTGDEVARLLRAAKKSRHGARNHAMILIAYRHGLRASELVNLRWSDVDLESGTIYCRRAKGSRSSVHPLKADETTAFDPSTRSGPPNHRASRASRRDRRPVDENSSAQSASSVASASIGPTAVWMIARFRRMLGYG